MSCFLKNRFLVTFLLILSIKLNGQFEKISIRNTSVEYEKDLLEDTANQYVKIMLCGDLIHRRELMQKYSTEGGKYNYRMWFRQVKPLFFYPDFVVASLRAFFPGRDQMNTYENSAPDEYLGELSQVGFNVFMLGNTHALTDREIINNKTLRKLDYFQIEHAGYYKDSLDKAERFPMVLEKKDTRIGFLYYSMDSLLFDLPETRINFFRLDAVKRDIRKTRDTMLSDYIICYMDWAGQDSLKLGLVAELLNAGIDVIIGTGSGEAFTHADLLSYSDGSLKLHIDNIGYFNALSNERERDKSAVIEVVLKRNKASKKVTLHDMGFIPLWTLIDNERYAVLPISNIEEKHIKNVHLNFVQYSTMKVALTDLRFAFFDKIPELHYDYNDKIVTSVEQTGYIRKTLMKEQDKINEQIKKRAEDAYYVLFETEPPSPGSNRIPYEDIWNMYPAKKSNKIIIEESKLPQAYYKPDSIIRMEADLKKAMDSLEHVKESAMIPNLIIINAKGEIKEAVMELLSLYEDRGSDTLVSLLMSDIENENVEKMDQIKSELTRIQNNVIKDPSSRMNLSLIHI